MSAFHKGQLCCYILRKSQSSFHVNIAGCATVSELKEKILLKNQNTIVGVDEHQLKIWKVCVFELSNLNQLLRADKHYISTKDLKAQLANLQLRDESPTTMLWMAPYCCPANFSTHVWGRFTLSQRFRMVGIQSSVFF